jgi:hypothetical protein
MEPPEKIDEQGMQAPCPRCGQQVHVIFKFCPFCGLVMKPRVEEAKSSVLPQERVRTLSPESKRKLMEFEKQFQELQAKREKKSGKTPRLNFSEPSIVRTAIILGILILLGFIGCCYILVKFAAVMKSGN